MKLVVGLGNPGRKYQQTRHNVGFMAAAQLAGSVGATGAKVRFEGELSEGHYQGERLAILCPHTFMNASGRSVRKTADFFKLSPADILVICDDLNLAVGRLRIRASGSAGGQKGLADIIRQLGSDSIPRLRIGIGRPPESWDAADYVLAKIASGERETIETAITAATNAALEWAVAGVTSAMNRYNGLETSASNQADNDT